MKKKFLVLLLLSTFLSQANDFQLTSIGDQEFSFPYIVTKTKAKQSVAENINTYLHLHYLELLPNTYKKSPFEVINQESSMPRLYVHNYEIEQNEKFISIYIRMEGCGAYCEEFDVHKVFLVKTGQVVHPKDLFTKNGVEDFDQINHQRIQKEIKAFLKTSADEEQQELYEECLNEDYKGKIHSHSEFSVKDSNFIFYSGRCSNHAMRALDDLGDFENSYSFKALEKHLSPFGNFLLNPKNTKFISPKTPLGIYKGKIGDKYPIGLSLSEVYEDGSLSAHYWYEKYKHPIELSGSYTNGKLELYVKKHNPEAKKWVPVEAIIGTLDNNLFVGSWENLESGKKLLLKMSK
jgi:hypothetical protein